MMTLRKTVLSLGLLSALVCGSANAELVNIMSYNTHHSEQHDGTISVASIADKIIREKADIVLLQEVDNKTKRTGMVDQTAEIARLAGLKYHKFGSFFDYDGGQYGMAIISRYPITASHNIPLAPGPEPRTSLNVTVDINGKTLELAGIHFYRDLPERTAQAQGVIDYFKDNKHAQFIAGDFNTTFINSKPTKVEKSTIDHSNDAVLMKTLTERWTHLAKRGDKTSFPSGVMWDDDGEGNVEIDHVFVNNIEPAQVKDHYLVEGIVSDHKPLMTVIDF
jgi:endonuclease/exonuclease/phosphatase family metal-dependent hydrolase